MLFEASTESFDAQYKTTPGMGIFSGQVLRFPGKELKVPQIGWNQIHQDQETALLKDVKNGSFVYFVHSYYVKPADPRIVACTTKYGIEYCSGITYQNVTAFQFHPEKSSRVGLQILKNFGELKS